MWVFCRFLLVGLSLVISVMVFVACVVEKDVLVREPGEDFNGHDMWTLLHWSIYFFFFSFNFSN